MPIIILIAFPVTRKHRQKNWRLYTMPFLIGKDSDTFLFVAKTD